ncbi:hypothetical protein [Beihai tiger crab virus 1]|uniref:hypothetical protein n=1 Tax=Beihai tiger crab virus 1 TaxID=1922711 RepID=UPI00090C3E6F|nr:hypothetical protein [Beihai tiger crab virus 1]APG77633.1 hypothetical protein [Beihai tiger crab virus 1]
MDNSLLGAGAAAPPTQPTTFGYEPHKTHGSPAFAGSGKDSVGFHNYGVRRYDKHTLAGSELIKVNLQDIKADTDFIHSVRDFLLLAGAKLMDRFEAYEVDNMTIAFNFPANWQYIHGFARTGWIMDPERTTIPNYDRDNGKGPFTHFPMRYTDARTFRLGHHCTYTLPIPRTKFFTGPVTNRFTSPGSFFFSAFYDKKAIPGIEDWDSAQMVNVTVTARVNYYCPTIRTSPIVEFNRIPGYQLTSQGQDHAFVFDQAYNRAYANVIVRGTGYTGNPETFFFQPFYINMLVAGQGDTDDPEKTVAINFPVTRGKYIDNGGSYWLQFDASKVASLIPTPSDDIRYTITNAKDTWTPAGFTIRNV